MRFHYAAILFLAMMGVASAQDAPAAPNPAPNQAPAATDDSAPAQDATDADPQAKLPKPSNAVEYAPTNEKVRFDFLTILNPDCTSMGHLSYRILSKPEHGEISFVQEDGFPNFKESNIRSRCNAGKAHGLGVYYQSSDQFVGEDKVTVLFLYPDASADVMDYDVVVR